MVSNVCIIEKQRQTTGEAGDEGSPSAKLCIAGTKVVVMGQVEVGQLTER